VKEARNQSQIFNRKSISRNTTHRQSYHLQAVLTRVKRRKADTNSEKVNNLKTPSNQVFAYRDNGSRPRTVTLSLFQMKWFQLFEYKSNAKIYSSV